MLCLLHFSTTFSLDGHKANGHTSISRTTDMSRPAPVRGELNNIQPLLLFSYNYMKLFLTLDDRMAFLIYFKSNQIFCFFSALPNMSVWRDPLTQTKDR